MPPADPKVDYAFKHVFGREATRPLLIDLLDCVLATAPDQRIRDIELLNPFNPKEAFDDKLSVLDIKARDQAGRHFNVEMQMLAHPDYQKRILYYFCRLHQQQLREGQDYLELRPTISITFLNDVLFPEFADSHLCFRLLERTHHFPLTGDIEFHVLELAKFTKSPDELASGLDSWLYFLRHAEKMDKETLPAALQRSVIVRALEDLTMLTQSDLEREQYEARRKAQLDHNTWLKVASMLREEAREKARQEGLQEGRQEGQQEGRQEGLREGRGEGEQFGEQIGIIHVCERLLGRVETPTAKLLELPIEELRRLADDVQQQVLRH